MNPPRTFNKLTVPQGLSMDWQFPHGLSMDWKFPQGMSMDRQFLRTVNGLTGLKNYINELTAPKECQWINSSQGLYQWIDSSQGLSMDWQFSRTVNELAVSQGLSVHWKSLGGNCQSIDSSTLEKTSRKTRCEKTATVHKFHVSPQHVIKCTARWMHSEGWF